MEIPLLKSADKLRTKQRAADFYKKRIAPTKARPATKKALRRTIVSHFPTVSKKEVSEVLAALTAAGDVVVNGEKVAYPQAP